MNQPPKYPSVTERNFECYVVPSNPGVKYYRHPSGVIVISLDSSHEAAKKDIAEIKWELSQRKGRGVDRSKLELHGKNKKGGLVLNTDTRLCLIHCKDGTDYTIRAGIRASMIEVNDEQLNAEPNLVRTASDHHGFIAIVLPLLSFGKSRHLAEMPKEFETEE